MTPLVEALMFNGITPPARGRKTTCPKCSHTRTKADEPCLKIYPADGWVEWLCFHCGHTGGDTVQ